MKISFLILASLFLVTAGHAADMANSDLFGKQTITVKKTDSAQILDRSLADLRTLFENYHPIIDPSLTVISPPVVSGTAQNPTLSMTTRKCEGLGGLLCTTTNFVADAGLEMTTGPCTKNFILTNSLKRSSLVLAEIYDALEFDGCFQQESDGTGTLTLTETAHHGPLYIKGGVIQQAVFGMLQQQIPAINASIQTEIDQ